MEGTNYETLQGPILELMTKHVLGGCRIGVPSQGTV